MKPIDKRFKFEEQILMKREVSAIKNRMLQMVEHAKSRLMHQAEGMMLMAQMQQMGNQVMMIRQRCQHIWEVEWNFSSTSELTHKEDVCVICESRRIPSSS